MEYDYDNVNDGITQIYTPGEDTLRGIGISTQNLAAAAVTYKQVYRGGL